MSILPTLLVGTSNGTGFELHITFDIKTNGYFMDKLLIKRYDVPHLLLDNEPILQNVMGCDIHWEEGRGFTYSYINKKQISKSGRRAVQIRTVNKRKRTYSLFRLFR